MKIKLSETVNIDPQAWADEYGIELADVRADVRVYFARWYQEQIDSLGLEEESTS
jgi:hypothetical protein